MRVKFLLLKHIISNHSLCAGDQIIGTVRCFSRKPPPNPQDCGADIVLNELCCSALALTTEVSRSANHMLMSDLVARQSNKVESRGNAGGARGPPGPPAAIN